jgi:3-oxoacyl-(acyl-carrier-protein) synthase
MPKPTEDIVITGAAMITPLGLTRHATWNAVKRGQCGIGAMSAMEQPLPDGRDGGQAPNLPGDTDAASPREVRYLRQTFKDALSDAGIDPKALPYPSHRCGILLGTTLHGMRAGGQFLAPAISSTFATFLPAKRFTPHPANWVLKAWRRRHVLPALPASAPSPWA